MRNTVSYKAKQFLVVLIKLSIVVGAFYLIFHKLADNPEMGFHVFIENLSKNDVFSLKNIVFLIILTVFNWFFEILKWNYLVSTIKIISFKESMEQSLGALTASLLTPNRVGEYGAKALCYTKPFRKKIVLLNLVGNMMQMATTVLFGSIALALVAKNYTLPINYFKVSLFGIIAITIFGILYFSLKKFRIEIKGLSLKKIIRFIYYIPSDIRIKTAMFSVIRYVIFSFQFYALLKIFGVPINYFNAMTFICSVYMLASIIPSMFIFDVVIKGSVAVYLFSIIGVNELTILCIVTLMWLLNFVVPSMFGSFYVLKFDLPIDDISP